MYVVTKAGEKKAVNVYGCATPIPSIKNGGKWLYTHEKFGKREYWYTAPLFIDTETSHDGENVAWVHQWAVCWGGVAIVGRTARELIDLLVAVNDWAQTQKGKGVHRVLAYIHNMSYDMEYLRQFFPGKEPEFFAVKPHRILTAKWNNLEMRCSYLLTQKSLAQWGKDSAKTYGKLAGGYDYDVIRTPQTPLTESEWSYQLNDVYTMWDAWTSDREIDGYTVADVPLTSTGFVRADCRNASKRDRYWAGKLREMQPDINLYNIFEKTFMGGYTHGNRFYKEETVCGDIGHRDFCSSYPARQMVNGFPMGKFTKTDLGSKNEARKMIYTLMPSTCIILCLDLENPRLRDRLCTAPYISVSKMEVVDEITEIYKDNGRLLECKGTIRLWLTEYDFDIVNRQYTADDFEIVDAYTAPRGKLPKWLRNQIAKYFEDKTTLKYIDPANYMLGKAKLNGIYGMTCERNVRPKLEYDAGTWKETELTPEEREAALAKYVEKDSTFLFFAWGVYTTALARYALFNCIEYGCGYAAFLYADTDSIFYIKSPETEANFAEYNDIWNKKAIAQKAYCEYKGKRKILGEFTEEDDLPITSFRFIHSKCYAIIGKDGLKVTIAGVTKKWRSDPTKSNADELGNIDNLTLGFKFVECGGSRIVYNNVPLTETEIDGCKIEYGASAVIMPTEYQIVDRDALDYDDMQIVAALRGEITSDIYGSYIDIK